MKIVLPNNIGEEHELKMGYKRVEILKSNDENKCSNFQDYEYSEKSSDSFQRMSVTQVLMLPWNKIQDQRYVKVTRLYTV